EDHGRMTGDVFRHVAREYAAVGLVGAPTRSDDGDGLAAIELVRRGIRPAGREGDREQRTKRPSGSVRASVHAVIPALSAGSVGLPLPPGERGEGGSYPSRGRNPSPHPSPYGRGSKPSPRQHRGSHHQPAFVSSRGAVL